jgi:molybdopterin-guanine dinucleotide biosynthesis protein MobB
MDKQGKDSWRLTQAGSDLTVLSSPENIISVHSVEHDYSLSELSRLVGQNFDVILTDGFKQDEAIKIEVHRQGMDELLCSSDKLLAVATDEQLDINVPQFALDDSSGIADLIEQRFLARGKEEAVSLFVNVLPTPLNPFVTEIFSRILTAVVSTLKGIDEANTIEISWKKGEQLHSATKPCASCDLNQQAGCRSVTWKK